MLLGGATIVSSGSQSTPAEWRQLEQHIDERDVGVMLLCHVYKENVCLHTFGPECPPVNEVWVFLLLSLSPSLVNLFFLS